MLSGGASFALYHIGVIKALYEEGLLPKIISGTSAGAIAASLICTKKPENIGEIF